MHASVGKGKGKAREATNRQNSARNCSSEPRRKSTPATHTRSKRLKTTGEAGKGEEGEVQRSNSRKTTSNGQKNGGRSRWRDFPARGEFSSAIWGKLRLHGRTRPFIGASATYTGTTYGHLILNYDHARPRKKYNMAERFARPYQAPFMPMRVLQRDAQAGLSFYAAK
ncbi:unnamed protein product [Linum trigynum]|uniref:Uncharacterized protein n=1 Tax=Linum trigynum TaxID=586398 RepID=A0AAV2CGB1_9ROSI